MSSSSDGAGGAILTLIVGVAVFFIMITVQKANAEKKKKQLESMLEIVEKNRFILAEKFLQLTYRDDYGNFIQDRFDDEFITFVKRSIVEKFPGVNVPISELLKRSDPIINRTLAEIRARTDAARPVNSPSDFEHRICDIFVDNGWDAKVVGKTGDQGIDVLAQNADGLKIGVQCKLYSSPVGNAAVQQAYSGARFHNAHFAFVVSSSGFTPQARQLADSLEVLLLSEQGLIEFLSETTLDDENPSE
jgi:restriction system protein